MTQINPSLPKEERLGRAKKQQFFTKAEVELMNQLRLLWEQHVAWTRMTIISIAEELADLDFVIQRLLQNPIDFQQALTPFYGPLLASEFARLLTRHLQIAAELVMKAKAGAVSEVADLERSWYENAAQIALFLSEINPFWSQETWQQMLFEHLALTKEEAVAILTADFEKGIMLYDEIEAQALEMADLMTTGIIAQFPQLF